MKFTGRIKDINLSWDQRDNSVTLSLNENVFNDLKQLKDKDKLLIIEVEEYRNRRTRDANACLWWCIQRIAQAINTDSWSVYISMLHRYGSFTTVTVKEEALNDLRRKWREVDEIGNRIINGRTYVDANLYFGSSTYNVQEFAHLLEGVISEMKEMGLETPLPDDIRYALERWEKHEKHNAKKQRMPYMQ